MFRNKGYSINNFKFSLLISVVLLSSIGLVVLQAITKVENTGMFKKQIVGVMAGIFIALVFAFIDYKFICKFYIALYILNILLMLYCKFVSEAMMPILYGKSVEDARRWIHVGPRGGGLDVMPSEITKLTIIICLAQLLIFYEGKLNKISTLAIIALVVGFPIALVLEQPDLSTTIVITLTFLIMIFVGGLSLKIVIPAVSVIVPAFIGFLWYIQQDYGTNIIKKYQRERILSLLHPEDYPDLMYQQNNARAAIKSGGVFGKLILGDDSPRLTRFVPVVESDFIFSAVGEELGFVGSALVIVLFALLLIISLSIAIKAKDKLGRYVAIGIASLITLQAFVNIGVVISLLPNTGIPLPFLSNGLSSLLTNYMLIGILLNIGFQNKDVNPTGDDYIDFGKYHKKF
ncbi:MAG: FtsW/RodA/SpoVE family cell cycle protein [Lachnospiraceae bacterium]|nr:FtsW/RodA/SpoVE family cell cycle protein [Lachnospiraceae bacterium]